MDHADRVNAATAGHKTLKKMIKVLAHAYELTRQYPNDPLVVKAFLANAYKSATQAAAHNGSWEHSYAILGIPDPEEAVVSVMSPMERLAMVALAKERQLLSATTKVKEKEKEKSGKGGKGDKDDS